MLVWLSYIFGPAAAVAVVVLCIALVRYYQDKHDSETFPTIVSIVSLAVVLTCLVLVPVDIFTVSTTIENGEKISADQISTRADVMKYLYLTLYGALVLLAFIVVPFAYFYYEEYDVEDPSLRRRIVNAGKYTVFLVIIVVILLLVGFFVRTGTSSDLEGSSAEDYWWNFLKHQNGSFTSAVGFIVGCLTVVGLCVWLTYVAVGLSALPIGMIKGTRNAQDEASDVQMNLEDTRRRAQQINSRYASGKRPSRKDEQQLDLLRRQERVYVQHSARLAREQGTFATKFAKYARPLTFASGIVLLLFAVFVVVSMAMTLIDKVMNSNCGYKCGYMLSMPHVTNPLDLLLTELARFFPLDYIAFGLVVGFFFFATIAGLKYMGIRFFWIHLFDFRAHRTAPQGLLLSSVFLMLAVLCLMMELLTLAPRYATFGTQTYVVNGTKTRCDLQAPTSACTMTQIASFLNIVTGVNQSFLGIIFYYATWLFLVSWAVGLLVTALKRRPENVTVTEEELLSEDDRQGI